MVRDSSRFRECRGEYIVDGIPFQTGKRYKPLKILGKGAYGIVASAKDLETDEENLAIKKITNVFETREDALKLLREIKILGNTRSGRVVSLKDIIIPTTTTISPVKGRKRKRERSIDFVDVYLVFDLMVCDLNKIIRSKEEISENRCRRYLADILGGLYYLNTGNVLHRDLKPGNILVDSKRRLKICDFGLSRVAKQKPENGKKWEKFEMTGNMVTIWYRAPELLLECENYGPAIDMWAAGCIFAEFLGRQPIFTGLEPEEQLMQIIRILGTAPITESSLDFVKMEENKEFLRDLPYVATIPFAEIYPEADPLAIDLLTKMLAFDPSKRITVAEALQHPYFEVLRVNVEALGYIPYPVDMEVEDDLPEEKIKHLILQQMVCYQPLDFEL